LKGPKTNDVKETIIRESIGLFLANGFRGTSVKQITEAAGISRGTLYWYFKSKEEIHITIFRKFEKEFLDVLSETVGRCEGDFTTKYRVFHKYSTEFARDNRELSLAYNTLLSEMLGTNTEVEKVAKSVHEKFHRVAWEMLERGKQDGSVSPEIDSNLYAHAIIACHMGMLDQWLVFGETMDVRAFVKTIRDFILTGITGKAV
jgi:AcrR family transcriptional regulator